MSLSLFEMLQELQTTLATQQQQVSSSGLGDAQDTQSPDVPLKDAPTAPCSGKTRITGITPRGQAGSGSNGSKISGKTPEKLPKNLPSLPPAPSVAPPLPKGTAPIKPMPCALCGSPARFATLPGTPVCPACWAKAYPQDAALLAAPDAPAEDEPDDARPWWERGAEPPCSRCGRPAGQGRDQWARPLCVDCWFALPQGEQMRAVMPGDAPERSLAPWKEALVGAASSAPGSGDDPDEACWLCGDVVEDYDPAGRAWCDGCLHAGEQYGWQDLLDAAPEGLRAERLLYFAAAAYHGADRPALWLDSGRIGSGESLRGAEVFARLGAALAAEDEPTRREARDRLTALVTSSGLGLRVF